MSIAASQPELCIQIMTFHVYIFLGKKIFELVCLLSVEQVDMIF